MGPGFENNKSKLFGPFGPSDSDLIAHLMLGRRALWALQLNNIYISSTGPAGPQARNCLINNLIITPYLLLLWGPVGAPQRPLVGPITQHICTTN